MHTNDLERDCLGIHASHDGGPGPAPTGADTPMGNDVCKRDGGKPGDVKGPVIDMASRRIAGAVPSFGGA